MAFENPIRAFLDAFQLPPEHALVRRRSGIGTLLPAHGHHRLDPGARRQLQRLAHGVHVQARGGAGVQAQGDALEQQALGRRAAFADGTP